VNPHGGAQRHDQYRRTKMVTDEEVKDAYFRRKKANLITGADGALGPGSGIKAVLTRTLSDVPDDLSPFAREVAILTLHRSVQAKVFQPIIDALKKLEARTDWSGGHLVIEHHRQTWIDAPYKHYESFADFYAKELETTWGKWEDLQKTWNRVAKGEISGAQANDEIRQRAARNKAIDEKDKANPSRQGRRTDLVHNNGVDVHKVNRPSGNSAAAFMRRLRNASKTDARVQAIYDRALAGELKPHAAMVEAGFRQPRASRKRTAFQRVKALLPELTAHERAELRRILDQV
jgi:hypothetical protein